MSSGKGDNTVVEATPAQDAHPRVEYNFMTAKRSGKSAARDNIPSTNESEISREEALTALTADEERKLLRKVDWRLIPLLCMLYLVKKLDESNVSVLFQYGLFISSLTRILGLKCTNHEPGHGSKHYDTARYHI